MITLHAVTKELGKGALRSLVLDQVTWSIPPRSRFAILGQQGAGKTTLLQLISGERFPNSGWIERRGSICPARGVLGGAEPAATPRQVAKRLARLYDVDAAEIIETIARLAALGSAMDHSLFTLPRPVRQRLNMALTFAIPFDFYLFDSNFMSRHPSNAGRMAFQTRSQEAGMILATASPKIAKQFGGTGGILLRGKIYLFDTLDEAIEIYTALPPPQAKRLSVDADDEELEEFGEWL